MSKNKTLQAQTERNKISNGGRRDFLLLLPFSVFAGMVATMASSAFRFLRPYAPSGVTTEWLDVAPVAQLQGDKPQIRTIAVERQSGWTVAREEHYVYVRPNKEVLSSACPHENCDVTWRDDLNRFLCPCHDSTFAADGARLTGPARRGLDPLPSRVQNGVLQVQFQSFVNNTAERTVRG
jgi:Rieske Fe-S protein